MIDELMNLKYPETEHASKPEKDKQIVIMPADSQEDEIETDNSFSYEGYQVVRGEFFAHISEPSISFCQGKLYVNTACLKKLSDVDYVQILVNKDEKKLVVRPATEDAKDAFLWCTASGASRKPKQITCRMFSAMLVNLMDWNTDYRYKIMGKVIRGAGERIVVFDLTATEIYTRVIKEGEKPKTSRIPQYPEAWKDQFGLPVEEHSKLLQVNIFDGYTVFGIKGKKTTEATDKEDGGVV